MKTIILAGGTGSRLGLITKAVNKQLLPIGNKPIICHVIDLASKVSEDVLIICNPEDMSSFAKFTEDYNNVNIFFRNQNHPDGIASAISLGESFCEDDQVLVLLGDNIFSKSNYDHIVQTVNTASKSQFKGSHVWTIEHESPHNYGVLVTNGLSIEKVIEKPKPSQKAGNQVVVGCYLFDSQIWNLLPHLKKSARGEYEIADLLNMYADDDLLTYSELHAGGWYDIGASANSYNDIASLFHMKEANEPK